MARRRIVLVSADVVARWLLQDGTPVPLSSGTWIKAITSDCPADIRVVGCGWDERTNTVRLAVESEAFDDIADGYFAPEWSPSYTRHTMTKFEAAVEVLRGD